MHRLFTVIFICLWPEPLCRRYVLILIFMFVSPSLSHFNFPLIFWISFCCGLEKTRFVNKTEEEKKLVIGNYYRTQLIDDSIQYIVVLTRAIKIFTNWKCGSIFLWKLFAVKNYSKLHRFYIAFHGEEFSVCVSKSH